MFVQAAKRTPVNIEEWAIQMMERHNRKSHLAPQLSPSTQALLRGESTASPSRESPSTTSKTPTSSDIPIANGQQSSMPTSTSDPPVSSRIIDVNGAGMYHEQTGMYDRQGYPPRTSSSLSQSTSRSRDTGAYDSYATTYPSENGGFNQTLPIRPAPPSGPLPQPPSSQYGSSTTPRPVVNGSPFNYGDGSQQHQ